MRYTFTTRDYEEALRFFMSEHMTHALWVLRENLIKGVNKGQMLVDGNYQKVDPDEAEKWFNLLAELLDEVPLDRMWS